MLQVCAAALITASRTYALSSTRFLRALLVSYRPLANYYRQHDIWSPSAAQVTLFASRNAAALIKNAAVIKKAGKKKAPPQERQSRTRAHDNASVSRRRGLCDRGGRRNNCAQSTRKKSDDAVDQLEQRVLRVAAADSQRIRARLRRVHARARLRRGRRALRERRALPEIAGAARRTRHGQDAREEPERERALWRRPRGDRGEALPAHVARGGHARVRHENAPTALDEGAAVSRRRLGAGLRRDDGPRVRDRRHAPRPRAAAGAQLGGAPRASRQGRAPRRHPDRGPERIGNGRGRALGERPAAALPQGVALRWTAASSYEASAQANT